LCVPVRACAPQINVPDRAKTYMHKVKPKPETHVGSPVEIQWRRFNIDSQRCRLFKVSRALCVCVCVCCDEFTR
jgi:hypothetical protein